MFFIIVGSNLVIFWALYIYTSHQLSYVDDAKCVYTDQSYNNRCEVRCGHTMIIDVECDLDLSYTRAIDDIYGLPRLVSLFSYVRIMLIGMMACVFCTMFLVHVLSWDAGDKSVYAEAERLGLDIDGHFGSKPTNKTAMNDESGDKVPEDSKPRQRSKLTPKVQ